MTPLTSCAFDLPDHLAAKADPALIARRRAALRGDRGEPRAVDRRPVGPPRRRAQGARRRRAGGARPRPGDPPADRPAARRCGGSASTCAWAAIVAEDGGEPVYVGRLGLTDGAGRRLLVDWRSPAAEPFFGATHANPMGLASRRRYRWTRGRVTDYWDEVFTPDGLDGHAALDDQSAFIASLGSSRSGRMRDVLATIQSDQDAIIRAGSRGTLVVDGGPGTGKTVVALHRAAYLLYADPRLGEGRGGVLFVGPHQPYLAYVADVLPSLGEEGVQTCTLRDLLPEGATASGRDRPGGRPAEGVRRHGGGDRAGGPALRGAADRGHGGRDPVGRRLAQPARLDRGVRVARARDARTTRAATRSGRSCSRSSWTSTRPTRGHRRLGGPGPPGARAERRAGRRLRPGLAADRPDRPGRRPVVGAGVPAPVCSLARPRRGAAAAAPRTRRPGRRSDLPLLDAARQRLGDPDASRRRRRQRPPLAAEREEMSRVVDHLIATDDSDMQVMSMLRGARPAGRAGRRGAVRAAADPDLLAGPFAHVVVDEAQELTDAEWQMLLLRCPSRSFTVVGDRAQARHGFAESWQERLERVGLDRIDLASLTHQLPHAGGGHGRGRAGDPGGRSPTPTCRPPSAAAASPSSTDRPPTWTRSWTRGSPRTPTGSPASSAHPTFRATSRVRSLTPELSKGLEFDLVVLVDPESLRRSGIEGAVDRYVAMTRATQQLVVLTST